MLSDSKEFDKSDFCIQPQKNGSFLSKNQGVFKNWHLLPKNAQYSGQKVPELNLNLLKSPSDR